MEVEGWLMDQTGVMVETWGGGGGWLMCDVGDWELDNGRNVSRLSSVQS